MKTTIKGTNISLTPAISEYVEKRLLSLDRFLGAEKDTALCHIEVGKTTQHHKHGDVFRAEMNLSVFGKSIYSASEEEDLYEAIDAVKNEMQRQLTQGKEKKFKLIRRGAQRIKNMIKGFYPGNK